MRQKHPFTAARLGASTTESARNKREDKFDPRQGKRYNWAQRRAKPDGLRTQGWSGAGPVVSTRLSYATAHWAAPCRAEMHAFQYRQTGLRGRLLMTLHQATCPFTTRTFMRIGVDTRLFYHQPAGISRYTSHLLREFARIGRQDEFVIFQHRRHTEPLVQRDNFRRATLYAPVHTRLEQWMLPLELARFSLDVLHSPDFIPPLYATVPTVITVHDLAFLHWPHFLTAASASYYGQIDRAAKHAKHIIVPSEHTKQDLIAQLGVPQANVSVIYEAADESFVPLPLEPTRAEVCRRYGLPEQFILFVGTIEPRKNVDGLLRAFHHLRAKYGKDDVALVIVGGQGWLYHEVLELINQLDLRQAAYLLGRVPDEELHKLYVAARCHVHAAHYEGFGLTPLEAMACGTPTIVSNNSSLPEVVGDAALLVNPNNWEEIAVAIHRLLTDDDLHADLSQRGLDRASYFSWERAARHTLDVYRQVKASPRAVAAPAATTTSSRSTHRL